MVRGSKQTKLICSAQAQLEPQTFITHHAQAWGMKVSKKTQSCFILGAGGLLYQN